MASANLEPSEPIVIRENLEEDEKDAISLVFSGLSNS